MKKIFALAAAAAIFSLSLFSGGCSADKTPSKITPNQSVLQKYPGLKGEYYADGETRKKATEKLINDIIPDILKKETLGHSGKEVNNLEVSSYDVSAYENGDAAVLEISAEKNNGEAIKRTVLVFIKPEQTEAGYRCYFLSYHNMDQEDEVTDEIKRQMLDDALAQAELK